MKQKIWMNIFTNYCSQGHGVNAAANEADKAMKEMSQRFGEEREISIPVKPDGSNIEKGYSGPVNKVYKKVNFVDWKQFL